MRPSFVGVTALVALAGCSIQPNSAPRDIPNDQQVPLEVAGPRVAGQATGTGRVFLVVTGEEEPALRSVLRNAVEPEPVIGALLEGPNRGELEAGLDTALPAELEVNSVRQSAGTLRIDVSEEILALTGTELRLAVAQTVFTANELESVRAVQLLVEGEAREWPDGRGELQAEPLTVYDFPGLAESAQPPYPPVPTPTA